MAEVAVHGAVVPSLWRIEIANTLCNSTRRGRSDSAFVRAAIGQLEKLPIREDDQTGLMAWSYTMALANEEGLTVYDATYLELALRRGLPLATGDRDLIAAGGRRGLEVLTP